MLYYYLVERGTDCAASLSDEDFHALIQKQSLEVLVGTVKMADRVVRETMGL